MRAFAILAASILLSAACGPDRRESEGGTPGERRLSVTAWDTAWMVGGSNQDSLLLNPFLVAAGGAAVYVFDGGANRLLAFDAERGALQWTAGRRGGGPLDSTLDYVA